ncbi:MAG: tyrosine-type recombinase/integrase [Elusimicrobiota bacterium]
MNNKLFNKNGSIDWGVMAPELEYYIMNYGNRTGSKHTVKQYFQAFGDYEKFFMKDVRTSTQEDIKRYAKDLETTGRSKKIDTKYCKKIFERKKLRNSSIEAKLVALYTCFGFLEEKKEIIENPVPNIRFPKEVKKLPAVLTEKEMDTLCKKAYPDGTPKHLRNTAMLMMACYTGPRLEEIETTELSNIRFDHKEIRYVGKGNKERFVPAHPKVLDAINAWIEARSKLKPKPMSNMVFLNTDYPFDPMKRNGITHIIEDSALRVLNKDIHPHTLRHSFGTLMRKAGYDIERIKRWMGHSDVKTTAIYSHIAVRSSVVDLDSKFTIFKKRKFTPIIKNPAASEPPEETLYATPPYILWHSKRKRRRRTQSLISNIVLKKADVSTILNEFESYINKFSKSSNGHTVKKYVGQVKKLLEFTKKHPAEISRDDLVKYVSFLLNEGRPKVIKTNKFQKELSNKPLTRNAVGTIIYYIRSFFRFLKENNYIAYNFMEDFQPPKRIERRLNILSEEEMITLIKKGFSDESNILHIRNTALLLIACYTGPKLEDIINIEDSDIDLKGKKIYYGKKNGKERYVPFHSELKKPLKKWLDAKSKFKLPSSSSNTFIDIDCPYKPLARGTIFNIIKTAAENAGIKKNIYPNLLRDTYGVLLYKAGIEAEWISLWFAITTSTVIERYKNLARPKIEMDFEI